MGHRLELDVVEVAAFAGDEARVLGPLDRLAEDGFDGGRVEDVGHGGLPFPYTPAGTAPASR